MPRHEMQNLEPLLIFITVADMGSFTLAADSLGIQKGRASTAVRKLEDDVGVTAGALRSKAFLIRDSLFRLLTRGRLNGQKRFLPLALKRRRRPSKRRCGP